MARTDKQHEDTIDPSKFGGSGPKVEPADLEGDTAVLTISKAERITFKQDGNDKLALKLYFEELGDKGMFIATKGDVATLVNRLGGRLSAWVGERVPVEKTIRKFNGEDYEKVVIVPQDDWDDILTPKRGRGRK